MNFTAAFGAAALSFAAFSAFAQDLPDLQGKEITIVTENAYQRPSNSSMAAARRSAGNMMRWRKSPSG